MATGSAANLLSVDSLFTTQAERDEAKRETVMDIPLAEISDFPNHPFKVRVDESMMEMADSVRQYGVLVPGLVRPKPDGGYEMVAGHRRKKASELAEKETVPCIVRDLTDDEATIIMVETSLSAGYNNARRQNRHIFPRNRRYRFFLLRSSKQRRTWEVLQGTLQASKQAQLFACPYSSKNVSFRFSILSFLGIKNQQQIDTTKANISYDVLEMSGSRAVWPEVLAVYAVKTTTDPDNAQEVTTMDDSKKAILKDIFWQMNQISSRTETKTEEVIIETDDGHGNIVETKTTVSRTYLYITVSHKTAEEMANQYSFNADQRKQLAELLADENRSMWSAVLYGIGTGDGEIVTVALSQIGNVGGEPYWSWYGFNSRVEWCACFVSWCANECGYIDAGVIPKFAGCVTGSQWFKDRGLWQDRNYEPRPGDIIFFDWDNKGSSGPQDGLSDHVGIVEKIENGIVYTVEGNSGDSCRENHYAVGYYEILGYGTPAY